MDKLDRRGFLAAAFLSVADATQAAGQTGRSPTAPFRVGCLNVTSYSHLHQLWAPLMNPRAGNKETPFTGMRITHCWEIDPLKSEEFARMYGCDPVRNFDDMVGKVDGIISGGFYNHPWNHILHEPYLEAGLPNLINRPFANSLAKARRMIETAKRHGATILCPSAFEYIDAMARARAWVSGQKILCYSATNSFDDYPTHGVHGLYMIHRAIAGAGNPIVSVAYQARSWHSPPGVMTLEHVAADGRPFMGTLHQIQGSWGTLQVHTPEAYGGKTFEIFGGTDFPFDKTEAWAPTLWAYQRMAMYGEMPESFDHILDKTRVFLAGWRSVLDGGRVVRVDDVPDDFESPVDLPNHPGDPTVGLFRKKFGSGKV
jgi:predicted dehydrogenase